MVPARWYGAAIFLAAAVICTALVRPDALAMLEAV